VFRQEHTFEVFQHDILMAKRGYNMTQFPKDQTFLKLIEATKINHLAEMQKLVTKLLQPPVETLEILKNQRLARAQLFEPY
jgi:hypothetical protein